MTMHLLIVDSDAAAAATTRAFVLRLVPTASVVCEATPEGAWLSAQQTPPNLLVIDPGPFPSTGRLLIQLCQALWPAIRVLLLTSAPVSPSRRALCQADAYFEKPAAPAQLRDALTMLLADTPPSRA